MKKIPSLFFTVIVMAALAACQFPLPAQPTPFRAIEGATATPDQLATIVQSTLAAGEGQASNPPSVDATPTLPPVFTATLPPEEPAPSATLPPPPAPTETPKPQEAGAQAEPTKTKSSGVAFNPRDTYGPPTFTDPLDGRALVNWADQKGNLPDTKDISIEIRSGKFYVTGKRPGFSTWWFSWPELDDFYIEMVADSKECAGKDAYGLIFRGPPHQAGISYGYVVALSCDGAYWIYRLDGVDPWRAETLVDWKPSDLVNDGSDQVNMLGVQMIGDKLTVYINGKSAAEVEDDEFSEGRYGFFVQADQTTFYTYQPLELYYWDLSK